MLAAKMDDIRSLKERLDRTGIRSRIEEVLHHSGVAPMLPSSFSS